MARYRFNPLAIRETTTTALPVSGATVTVYLAGTSTLATCYANTTTATALTGSQTTTTASGYFEFFIDGADYRATQRFKITISKTGYPDVTYDNLNIFGPISNEIKILDFLPEGYVTDGSVDYTTKIQAANDAIDTTGGTLKFPSGTWKFNLTASNGVNIRGTGVKSTILRPATDEAVIKTKLTDNTANVVYKNFQIYGDSTFTTQGDGIRLKATTAGKFISNVILDNVLIKECGRYGLTTYGSSTSGPFVQQLTLRNVNIYDSVRSGLYVDGYLFEAVFENAFIYRNGNATYPNVESVLNGASGAINRLSWIGGVCHHTSYPTTGIAAKFSHSQGVSIEGVAFEHGNKLINFVGNQTGQIDIKRNRFVVTNATTSAIEIEDVDSGEIANNYFAGSGATMTNAIYDNASATSRIKNLRIHANRYAGTITNTLNMNFNVTIATGAIYAYRDLLRVDTEAAAASDDLDYIYDQSGTASVAQLQHGQMITIRALNAVHDVVVKHGTGNIMTKAGTDITLDETYKTVTLRWDINLAKWLEI